ncbi:MAG: DUF4954 family protein [Bacteroidaceae bacterium]|nr:DUF4954 family protein [Bacteroidaceae bacterium]
MEYRHLSQAEIAQLEMQGCTAEDWTTIQVHPQINVKYIRQVRFSGECRIGHFEKAFTMPGGIHKHSGLFHVSLHNVVVGDNCCIENIKNYIANYDIEANCFIENVDIILVDGVTRFGNGVEVSVLNETGGREVTIHDQLTAQEAYMQAMYRHRPALIEKLKKFADEIGDFRQSDRGHIGHNSVIVDTGYIKNLYIGPCCEIEGAGKLKNGSIMSREDSPVHIGYGVIAEDFIVQDGSHIEDCTTISRVYVGQACTLGHGYSASDSLFFCNCQEENGEACAIFAGPFTVTHHKSTLLIAGMFSFMNAGSGSNQSNHMYKLGPIHQGALERGAKTASDSYILWPARIGAFSLVMGRHSTNPNTSALPFSYLIEKQGETWLAPAVNLRSVGTIRDAQKWPKRDNRPAEGRLDLVNFNLLSPYTIDKMVQGLAILEQLRSLSGATSDTYTYQSAKITHSALERGIMLYRMAIEKFLGNSLISRLEKTRKLKPESNIGEGDWLDLSGLIAPHTMITQLMNDIEAGKVTTNSEMNQRLHDIHQNYYDYEWAWAYQLMLHFYNLKESDLDKNEVLVDIIKRWKQAVVGLDKMLYQDAQKEFSLSTKTGFGFDGNTSTAEADFAEVRGQFESNPFVTAVQDHIAKKSALGEKWIERLG